jgi:hypothetical protein
MPYTALPDRRMPYDNDGTLVGYATNGLIYGVQGWADGTQRLEMQDEDWTAAIDNFGNTDWMIFLFFPETREITAFAAYGRNQQTTGPCFSQSLTGSADSTNGLDGTWETASLPGGSSYPANAYSWRESIKPISFTGPKRVLRVYFADSDGNDSNQLVYLHVYGEKAAGQTPDDVIFINHDDTPGGEYTACEDFGDQPLATTVVRQFRLKNASSSKTANTINIQCNDTDFAISTDNVNWVVTINLASLAAGAESPTYYVRCTTPAVGGLLGPRFARIVTTVASYT